MDAVDDVPNDLGAPERTYGGGLLDAFLAQLDPSGSTLGYSTYIGGESYDAAYEIATDRAGVVYLAGDFTSSNNAAVRAVAIECTAEAPVAGGSVDGTGSRDVLCGAGGEDVVSGGSGNDIELLGGDDDVGSGGSGRDVLVGARGEDALFGQAGSDRLVGGKGRDAIVGGDGRDRIYARDGERDVVRCGPGRDYARVDSLDRTYGCERVDRA